MRKLSVFYEHILQACEQSGKTIPEVLAFCREQGISAVEMNYSLFASEREVIAPMLSDAGLVISCMHETFDFSHDTDLGRAQQMLDTAASQQVSRVLFVAGALETAEAAELAACSSTYEATSTFMAENKSIQNMGLRMAIEQAEKYGLLGDNILNSGVNFHLHINRGAGAFVCGEGSALTASIEGNRGMPRVKPPRTVEKGLWGKPTVLNNVETYANVPKIILQGADWFRTIGTEGSPGTKTFSLTGSIENTGLIEVPMGTTLRHIIYDIGGGLKSGAAFKGVQIGGPSGGCLILDQLDAPLDFDSVKKLDAIMGSGGLVVMDENTCMVEVARFFMNFTQRESCGKCVPCREGTKRMLEILERIVDGKGEMSDLDELEELANMVQNMALCGLGKSAPLPVISTLKRFRDEYEEHICDKKCRAKVCTALRQFHINPEFCIGCGKCAKNCPAGAISGKIKHPYHIDNDICIKCGACKDNCNFDAVYVEA